MNPRLALSVAAIALTGACVGPNGEARGPDSRSWVASWGASPQKVAAEDAPLAIAGQTLRQVVRVSVGGARVRVRLSNRFGAGPLTIGAAHVALTADGASIVEGSDVPLTFGGAARVTLAPGASVTSDPAPRSVGPLHDLTVSLYVPGSLALTTTHSIPEAKGYLSTPGDFTGATTLADPHLEEALYVVAAVDVEARSGARAIVFLGDSVTDGVGATPLHHRRWTDVLEDRLSLSPIPFAIVNEGIAGNRVLRDTEGLGLSALHRFDEDVLAQPGVAAVVVLEGLNDIGIPGAFHLPDEAATVAQILDGHRELIARAHARGVMALGGTLTPFADAAMPGYYSPEGEAKRQAVNEWIRASGSYDGVIDFDRVLRDPAHPTHLLPQFDSGDHLHPNDAGHAAMAAAIDASFFERRGR